VISSDLINGQLPSPHSRLEFFRPGIRLARVFCPVLARVVVAGGLVLVLASGSLRAGAPLVESSGDVPFSSSLSTGWDSLYMFRGVNQLPGPAGYGSSLSWTALSLGWSPTAQDSFTVASWAAFGLSQSDYKEIDASLTYTRTLGSLSLSAAYSLYAVLSSPGGLYSHELSVSAAYTITRGAFTFTPSVDYAYTLGPSPGEGGYVDADTGYLEARLDADLPLYRDYLHAAPWVAAGFNFGYSTTDTFTPFTGADHFELGLSFPITLAKNLNLAPYFAYSHTWLPLAGTRRDTPWAGVSVTFSF
jgi:hypothetical protein